MHRILSKPLGLWLLISILGLTTGCGEKPAARAPAPTLPAALPVQPSERRTFRPPPAPTQASLPAESPKAAGNGDVRPIAAGPTNLIATVDASRDVIRGDAERRNATLRVVGKDALVRIPVRVAGDYELSARVRRASGDQQIVVIIPVRDRHASLILDWNTHDLHGLETIDDKNIGANGQAKGIAFETGRWYELVLSVRHEAEEVVLEAKLDDQQLFRWRGKAEALTVWHPWTLPDVGTLGLANWDSGPEMVAEYERLELTSLGGTVTELGDSRTSASTGLAIVATPPPPIPLPETPAVETAPPARPVAVVPVPSGGSDWPCFRGPDRLGISNDRGLPVTWSDDKSIVWKRELPGPGASSPIVWGDRIYVTSYSGYGLSESSPGDQANLQRHLVCVDRETGRNLWKMDMANRSPDGGFAGFRALHGYATSTPVADEAGVYVMYGSSGAAAYTHDGELRWQRSLGTGAHDWGSSASPVLFENLVIYLADIEGQKLIALDKASGEPVWNVPTGQGDSWSTPCLAKVNGRSELIFHHSQGEPLATLAAVDPRDGAARWQCRVLKDYLCPSPIVAGDKCFILAHQRGAAIRVGGQGDVTDSHVEWTTTKGTEVCTPLYHDEHLYWAHQESGIAYCLNAQTGRVVYEERIQPRPGRIYASGVQADGRIYYVSRESGTYVVAAAPQFRLLAHNRIESDDSIFNGTPAISRGRLLLRSNKYLYCIGER